jgi:hypothetical protein
MPTHLPNRASMSKTSIEQGEDTMQTNRRPDHLRATASTIALYAGDGFRATGAEADFHAGRLLAEAARDHARVGRPGLRHRVGHALIALGREIHGLEAETTARPALRAR